MAGCEIAWKYLVNAGVLIVGVPLCLAHLVVRKCLLFAVALCEIARKYLVNAGVLIVGVPLCFAYLVLGKFLFLARFGTKFAVARFEIARVKLSKCSFLIVGVPWCFAYVDASFGRGCNFVFCAVCRAVVGTSGHW